MRTKELVLALIIFISVIGFMALYNPSVTVVQDRFVTILEPETGIGLFQGHTLAGKAVFYKDTACRHPMGDTITIKVDQIQ